MASHKAELCEDKQEQGLASHAGDLQFNAGQQG